MALIISLAENEEFWVGEMKLELIKVFPGERHFLLSDAKGEVYEIMEDRATETLPNVWISSGTRVSPNYVRVVIDAPPEIRILRKGPYEESVSA